MYEERIQRLRLTSVLDADIGQDAASPKNVPLPTQPDMFQNLMMI
jgi:hypothetical protein